VPDRERGFVPPTYPYDRLKPLAAAGQALPGGLVDLSIGTPYDPPPSAVVAALGASGAERGYPSGIGSARLIDAARGWVERRFGVSLERGELAACIGTKELVAGMPHWLRLRDPGRDTVLYPAISYPTYAMGAALAGCRAVAVPARPDGTLDLEAIGTDDLERALCLWVNSPANPTGRLEDLGAAASFGRAHGVPVLSDECYAEFTWDGAPRTILEHGLDGVLAVHSISKRSNCAGLRVGFYAGDPDLVAYLGELRRHAGFMVPGPVQLAGAVALEDDEHVELQRQRYAARLARCAEILGELGVAVEQPGGGFYLWVRAPLEVPLPDVGPPDETEPTEWRFARQLAVHGGALVSPGELYGRDGAGYVRIAVVQPLDRIELVAERLARASSGISTAGITSPR
jgi:aspartate/methionine/tyrosine aminotransferase